MHHHAHFDCACHTPLTEGSAVQGNKVRLLWAVLILLSCFSLVEWVVSFSSRSLALMADVGHMFADGLAIGLALFATWIAQLPRSDSATFGYRRVEILAALANGLGLVAIAVWVAWEAVLTLKAPPQEIASLPMLITAVVGLGINSLNAFLLHRGSTNDLNLKGAFLHVVADAVSSIGIILAAIAVGWLHWLWADSAISLLVAGLIFLGALPLITQSLNVLLEKPSSALKVAQVRACLESFEPVVAVNHLRLWTVALGQEVFSAQLQVELREGEARDRLLRQIQSALLQEFGIQETVLQMSAPPLAELAGLPQPELIELMSVSTERRLLKS